MALFKNENIDHIVSSAAEFYNSGKGISNAIFAALDKNNIFDGPTRTRYYPVICSCLGTRGGMRKAAMKRKELVKAGQQSLSF